MPDLFDRLSTAARPYEIAVGKIIEEQSKYKYIQDKTSMDYDVYLINPNGQQLTVEVKVHEGTGAWGKYDTACLEILEYQYRHNDYVSSHWLSAPFKVMAHVDKASNQVHLFNGQTIRQWALARKHTARYSSRVKTANIKMPWKCKEAGYLLTLPLQSSI
jgi:hypothetical protein